MSRELQFKWVHSSGANSLAYARDGSMLFTGGDEGFTRCFAADPERNDDDSLHTIDYKEPAAPVTCLDSSVCRAQMTDTQRFTVSHLLALCFSSSKVLSLATRTVSLSSSSSRLDPMKSTASSPEAILDWQLEQSDSPQMAQELL